MRLVPPPGRIVAGTVTFEGRDLLTLPREQMRKLRGGEMAMIFQNPMSSLNPLLTIGRQIAESVMEHQRLGRKEAYARAVEMLQLVGVPGAQGRTKAYPHEFSGGMRQRVMIAMALANNPKLLIADEPTTALDVTIQAQVLDLIRGLSREFNSSVIFITHNLGIIASIAARVVVMYAGRVMETGTSRISSIAPRTPIPMRCSRPFRASTSPVDSRSRPSPAGRPISSTLLPAARLRRAAHTYCPCAARRCRRWRRWPRPATAWHAGTR
jgi:oligopeptide transport system ATP-binding protein